jgi:hypothetical protein
MASPTLARSGVTLFTYGRGVSAPAAPAVRRRVTRESSGMARARRIDVGVGGARGGLDPLLTGIHQTSRPS